MFGDIVIRSYKKIIKKIKKSKLSDDKKIILYNRVNEMLEEYKNKRSDLIKNDTESLNFLANMYDQQNQIIESINIEAKEQKELKKIDEIFINPKTGKKKTQKEKEQEELDEAIKLVFGDYKVRKRRSF